MAAEGDLRLTQSVFPGWDIDGIPGNTAPDAGLQMQDQIVQQVIQAQIPVASIVAPSDLAATVVGVITANPNPDYGPPAQPSAPTIQSIPSAIVVNWDGLNADGTSTRTPDWDHVAVHVSLNANFVPDDTTMVASIHSTQPSQAGQAVYATTDYDHDQYVKLVAVARSGRTSAPSTAVSGRPSQITNLDIKDFVIDVTKFIDDRHHLF